MASLTVNDISRFLHDQFYRCIFSRRGAHQGLACAHYFGIRVSSGINGRYICHLGQCLPETLPPGGDSIERNLVTGIISMDRDGVDVTDACIGSKPLLYV